MKADTANFAPRSGASLAAADDIGGFLADHLKTFFAKPGAPMTLS